MTLKFGHPKLRSISRSEDVYEHFNQRSWTQRHSFAPPNAAVKIVGSSGAAGSKSAPLDLSVSKGELGYTPQFPLNEALRGYLEELRSEQRS